MKKINFILISLVGLFALACDNFLDETPDNRTEVDTQSKVRKLLVAAYPNRENITITELSSDNIADFVETNPNSTRFLEQIAYWKDITEKDNSDGGAIWQTCYEAIANANEALVAIEKLELKGKSLAAEKGEALIARAYAHFILVNTFSKHYNTQTSNSDLGIPYATKPEKTLSPKYKRGTVAEVYEKINADIEAGLPLINDEIYQVGLYHFTKKAAYAFAARFNLYYERWQKAKDYASVVLSDNIEAKLRDWKSMGELPNKQGPKTNEYINNSADLLAIAMASDVGILFGPFGYGARFNHTRNIAMQETVFAPMPWAPKGVRQKDFRNGMFEGVANNIEKILFFKIPYLFEVKDAIQQTGYTRTVVVPFTTDETLLVRAEAEAMLGQNTQAVNDLNLWTKNFYKDKETTLEQINDFYNSLAYSTPEKATSKKKLSPKFVVSSGIQENLIHYILQCRRVLTLHEGLRWYDIKRYGIEINRRKYLSNNSMVTSATLAADDNRKAIQIPLDVLAAGLEANQR